MSELVFVSGDFSSGTTLLFTLFRRAGGYCCLYEPLHERLPEYLIWPLRAYDGHHHVGDYFTELRRFREIPRLFRPDWGSSRLLLRHGDEAPELYRYLAYVVGSAFAASPRVLVKENRLTFRLEWLRARFPDAKILHVWRDRDEQWRSVVRRVQQHLGRTAVGQDDPGFAGFNIAAWCDDLAPAFPELTVERWASGYERFSKLWELSLAEHRRHADVSVSLAELTGDFERAWNRIAEAVGCDTPASALRPYVVSPAAPPAQPGRLRARAARLVDLAGRAYARRRAAHLADRR